jgi:hypothetical protein
MPQCPLLFLKRVLPKKVGPPHFAMRTVRIVHGHPAHPVPADSSVLPTRETGRRLTRYVTSPDTAAEGARVSEFATG